MTKITVQKNYTLSKYAKLYGVSVNDIVKANGLSNPDKIKEGQTIIIPEPIDSKKTAGLDTVSFSKKADSAPASTNKTLSTHTVKKGDNLEKISKKYFIPLEDLKKANKDVDPSKLQVGQKLTIPEKKSIINTVNEKDEKFKSILPKILKDEGGFKPAEKDGSDVKTNKGITQDTYNRYLKDKAFDKKQKNAEIKDVKNITEKEVKEIYYNYYYKKCGADKEEDNKTAYWMTDTAVNCGVKKAQNLRNSCGTDNEKWYNSRKETYETIIKNNPSKKKFLGGWTNRIDRIKDLEDM